MGRSHEAALVEEVTAEEGDHPLWRQQSIEDRRRADEAHAQEPKAHAPKEPEAHAPKEAKAEAKEHAQEPTAHAQEPTAHAQEPTAHAQEPKQALRRRSSNREGEHILPLPPKLDLASARVRLYEFALSPPCWKVRALLHFYQVPYESVFTLPHQPRGGLDRSYGKIPKLTIDELQINDSEVIIASLAPLLAGASLTPRQAELERLNNSNGLVGALELETVCTFWGLVGCARAQAKALGLASGLLGLVVHTALLWVGLFAIITKGLRALRIFPGASQPQHAVAYARTLRTELGDAPYFHGAGIGPLDLSLYGTFAWAVWVESPLVVTLDASGLRDWFERCDEAIRATRPIW